MWLLIVIFLGIIAICSVGRIAEMLSCCKCGIQEIAEMITAMVAILAFCYTKEEYDLHVKREKTATLAQYNERYATDPNIQKVINYLLWKGDGAPEDIRHYGGESVDDIMPTKNEVEMFMRFFEELEISIEAKRLDPNIAKDLFAYYAHELPKIESYLLPDDYEVFEYQERHTSNDTWHYFKEFIKPNKQQENN